MHRVTKCSNSTQKLIVPNVTNGSRLCENVREHVFTQPGS
jgi:hypothetical protein